MGRKNILKDYFMILIIGDIKTISPKCISNNWDDSGLRNEACLREADRNGAKRNPVSVCAGYLRKARAACLDLKLYDMGMLSCPEQLDESERGVAKRNAGSAEQKGAEGNCKQRDKLRSTRRAVAGTPVFIQVCPGFLQRSPRLNTGVAAMVWRIACQWWQVMCLMKNIIRINCNRFQ